MENPNMAPFVEAELVERFIEYLSGVDSEGDTANDWKCLSLYELRERYKQFITAPPPSNPRPSETTPSIPLSQPQPHHDKDDVKAALQIFAMYHNS